MDDKTLLERAAKAAGMWATDFEIEDDSDQPVFVELKGFRLAWGRGWWNPLQDDGDALRLVVKLKLHIGLESHLSLIHISEPTRRHHVSRMPSSA